MVDNETIRFRPLQQRTAELSPKPRNDQTHKAAQRVLAVAASFFTKTSKKKFQVDKLIYCGINLKHFHRRPGSAHT